MRKSVENHGHQSIKDRLGDVTQRVVHGNGKATRRARSELMRGIEGEQTADAAFSAISALQNEILRTGTPDKIKNGFEALDEVIDKIILPQKSENFASIRFSRNSSSTVEEISEKNDKIQNNRSLQRFASGSAFKEFSQRVIPQVIESFMQNSQVINLNYVSPRSNIIAPAEVKISRPSVSLEEAKRIVVEAKLRMAVSDVVTRTDRDWRTWTDKIDRIAEKHFRSGNVDEHAQTLVIDELLTEIQLQPFDLTTEFLFEREVKGLSLAGIRDLPHPLSAYDAQRVTKFFIEGRKVDLNDNKALKATISNLITISAGLYDDDNVPNELTNWSLLRNVREWKQYFWHSFLFETDQQKLKPIVDLYSSLQDKQRGHFARQFPLLAGVSSAYNSPEVEENNPFYQHAVQEYMNDHSEHESTYFIQRDDLWVEMYNQKFGPLFLKRIEDLGFKEKMEIDPAELLQFYAAEIKETAPEIRAIRIARLYELHISRSLINETNERVEELKNEAKDIWNDALQNGLTVLPLHNGVEVVHFTEQSTLFKMGVSKIYLNRDSLEDNWGVNVRFDFVDPYNTGTSLTAIGKIEHDGTFSLTTPLDREELVPGIHALLNKMAVLTFKDVTYQREVEVRVRGVDRPDAPEDAVDDILNQEEKDRVIKKQTFSQLPRTKIIARSQTGRELEKAVTPKIKMDPRRIGTHKMNLAGYWEYNDALQSYYSTRNVESLLARNSGAPIESVVYAVDLHEANREILRELRKKVRKASQKKLEIWPENVQQVYEIDPLTGEMVYANTWVVEHTRPKLTPEQELEIVLWQRNYRVINTSSTALSTLDEFKKFLV